MSRSRALPPIAGPEDPRHGSRQGYNAGCRQECCRAAKREWAAQYRAANEEKVKAKERNYQAANKEKIAARKADRRASAGDEERIRERERCARYRAANRKKRREADARYRAKNLEARKEYQARYRASPEGKATHGASGRRRRARKLSQSCDCCKSATGYQMTWARDDGRCAYCAAPATDIEHVIPLAGRGWDCVWNLRASCSRCNSIKGDRPLSYLLARLTAEGTPIRPGATNSGLPCPAAAERMSRRMLTA